jgi:hypothetical protein
MRHIDVVVLFWQYQYSVKCEAASMLVTGVSVHVRKANSAPSLPSDKMRSVLPSRSLEAFAETEFNEMFSGKHPRRGVKFVQCFRDKTRTGFGFTNPLATP